MHSLEHGRAAQRIRALERLANRLVLLAGATLTAGVLLHWLG